MGTKSDLPTMEDVAALARVSPGSVSRSFGGRYPIAEATRRRIEEAASALGYVRQKRPRLFATCTLPDCGKKSYGTRICSMHRERMRRSGTYDDPIALPAVEAFWSLVDKTNECWIWGGYITEDGYGTFTRDGVQRYTHRYAYQLEVGQIGAGLHLDHACHTRDVNCVEGAACPHRRCCNPAHLEPVTGPANVERSVERRLACRRGHPWIASNIYIRPDTGHRVCRACAKLRAEAKAKGLRLTPTRRIGAAA